MDNKGIIDGLWRGERKCIDPKAGDADLWILIWEELHNLAGGDILAEVEHVKAHRPKQEKQDMSHFEKFVTEGNEKADELAKEGAMLDEGFMAEARARTMQQEREEVYAALQYAARSQNKNGLSWIRKERKRNIELSGVLRPISIDA